VGSFAPKRAASVSTRSAFNKRDLDSPQISQAGNEDFGGSGPEQPAKQASGQQAAAEQEAAKGQAKGRRNPPPRQSSRRLMSKAQGGNLSARGIFCAPMDTIGGYGEFHFAVSIASELMEVGRPTFQNTRYGVWASAVCC